MILENNRVRNTFIIVISIILVIIVMSFRTTPETNTITAIENADWNQVYDYLINNPMPPVESGLDGKYISIILSADAAGNIRALEPCTELILRSHEGKTVRTCTPIAKEEP